MKSNFLINMKSAHAAGSGHWNDPDMLVVGNDIQSDVQSGKVSLKRNKLVVHKEVGDLETTL